MSVFLGFWEQKRLLLGAFLLPAAWWNLAYGARANVD